MPVTNYTTANGVVLQQNKNGARNDLMPDTLGSTAALLNNSQANVTTYEYWPYGEVVPGVELVSTSLKFVGATGYYQDRR